MANNDKFSGLCYLRHLLLLSRGVNCELCMCVKRLRPYLDELGAMLLADEESSIMQQVHAVNSVENSIFMESSLGPRVHEDR